MVNWVSVPKELGSVYFFPNEEVSIEEEHLHTFSLSQQFLYDLAYYLNIPSLKPWENIDDYVHLIIEEWEDRKTSLEELFKLRDKKLVQEPMKKSIALLIQFLHWVNGAPVKLFPTIEYQQLAISPVNLEERLSYILSRPNAFPSYMQLIELMKEIEKSYEKNQAIKRIKK